MRLIGIPFLLFTGAAAAFAAGAGDCPALKSLAVKDATLETAEKASGAVKIPGQPGAMPDMPSFCRVAGILKPSADSEIHFEVWLPDEANWNGRYLGAGNGGYAGSISYGPVASAVRRGYASGSTDTGHVQKGLGIDGSWANGHPEKLVDYGHRAIHVTTVTAKTLMKAYYSKPLAHSYFSSCSNGGRQALMEAQRYPEDFDGIIAGAPANNFTHIAIDFLSNVKALAEAYVPSSKLPAIEAAVLQACDAKDGVKDGVVDDPRKCNFDPASIACTGAETDSCLTSAQAATIKKIYAGVKDAKGHLVMDGFEPGGESGPGGWGLWINGSGLTKSLQFGFGSQMYMHMVYSNKDWDYKTFEPVRDGKAADEKLGPVLNATETNLKPFEKRGGKLILYHGWCDAALPPQNTIHYYEAVRAKMGAKTADQFVRLYMLPGVQHCGGGPGPNRWGDWESEPDGTSNMIGALEKWVEKGVAPQGLTAVRYKNNRASAGVERSRPICAYPMTAKYKGSGSTDEAANFVCSK